MKLTVGQRWKYRAGDYAMLAEITNLSPLETEIISANQYGIDNGYTIGGKHDSMGIDTNLFQRWTYLEGQDRPQ